MRVADEGPNDRLAQLLRSGVLAPPGDALRGRAQRLLRVHPLRAADTLQLAAALTAAGEDPGSLPFVCLDQRLADAARREGLEVIAP